MSSGTDTGSETNSSLHVTDAHLLGALVPPQPFHHPLGRQARFQLNVVQTLLDVQPISFWYVEFPRSRSRSRSLQHPLHPDICTALLGTHTPAPYLLPSFPHPVQFHTVIVFDFDLELVSFRT